MNNQIQTASEVKNSSRTCTLAHETRKSRQLLAMFLITFTNQSGVVEADTISKNGASLKSQMRKGNLRLALLMLFSITGISLFGQVTDPKEKAREILSNVSSIVESDAKELGLIFSIGFEIINDYQVAIMELDKTQILIDYFSNSAKRTFGSQPISTSSDFVKLGMSGTELGAEIVNRIGNNSALDAKMRKTSEPESDGRHSSGYCSRRNAGIMRDILTQEFEDWKTAYYKAEKALVENIDIIELIPPDYRYPLALSTMHGIVRNYRATTWKESVDLYEEQFHRWIMEKNSAESIRIQTEIRNLTAQVANNTSSIARSSRATAIFTGLMYLGW